MQLPASDVRTDRYPFAALILAAGVVACLLVCGVLTKMPRIRVTADSPPWVTCGAPMCGWLVSVPYCRVHTTDRMRLLASSNAYVRSSAHYSADYCTVS